MGYSCRTLLRDTLLRHSSGTLLRDTLVGLSSSSPDTRRTKVVLQGRQFSASSSPDTPRTTVALQGRQFSASSSAGQIALSPRSPQRVARAWDKSHSRLHFAHSTRTISAEGCARMGQIALSPAFGALDTHDLRRGLRVKSPKRAFRTRLPQKLTRQSLPKLKQCRREVKPLRPFWESGLDVFLDCVHRKEMQQL